MLCNRKYLEYLWVAKEIVPIGEGQKQETTESKGYSVKEPACFEEQQQQLPEEPLLNRIVRGTNSRAVSLTLRLQSGRACLR